MKKLSAAEEMEVLNRISKALNQAEEEGQPVKELAEAAARGRQLKCCLIPCGNGRTQLVVSLEDE